MLHLKHFADLRNFLQTCKQLYLEVCEIEKNLQCDLICI